MGLANENGIVGDGFPVPPHMRLRISGDGKPVPYEENRYGVPVKFQFSALLSGL